eukprot:CAMPEP_0185803604 /NCGR_PEP_ID=MMETSP1322-20130828/2744_1 /TAXON_ID=265543 /ORGANISM="Minutocellus polymorphus, Strain RCC2270" /LENGTH=501 /DNA_ID=CAMNT_0028499511 /DNA_START=139 /DNA_END=1644 /DNA_ORIENTATION=+
MPPVENRQPASSPATYSPPSPPGGTGGGSRRASFPFRVPSASAGKDEGGIEEGTPPRAVPFIGAHHSPSATPTKELYAPSAGGGTIGRKRRRKMAVVVACLAVPAAFLIIYGAVASTQDFIQFLNQDAGGGGGGGMTTTSSAGSASADLFDGTVTAPTSSQHDHPSNPFLAFLTGTATSDSDADVVVGLGTYLSSVVSPHAPYKPANQIALLWTPGAPNDGFLVNKIRQCVDGVVQASYLGRTGAEESSGTTGGDHEERPISVVGGGDGDGSGDGRGRYVDVDMSTLHGLQRAKDHNLVDSGLADVVISPFLPEILDLFDSTSSATHHRPRLFLLLQDVKARLRASYTYLHGQSIFPGSYLEFISSNHILANDYLVRMLSGKWDVAVYPPESLTQEDLHIAVQELQTKFSVGVMRHVQPYLEHMVDLLGWQPTQPGAENIVGCMFPTAAYDEAHPPSYPQSKPPDETAMETQMREIIRNRNSWDMRLLEIFVQRWDDGVFA